MKCTAAFTGIFSIINWSIFVCPKHDHNVDLHLHVSRKDYSELNFLSSAWMYYKAVPKSAFVFFFIHYNTAGVVRMEQLTKCQAWTLTTLCDGLERADHSLWSTLKPYIAWSSKTEMTHAHDVLVLFYSCCVEFLFACCVQEPRLARVQPTPSRRLFSIENSSSTSDNPSRCVCVCVNKIYK